jgi:mannose-6-phosphate isomerase-like protein (cupin superfamily)
MTRDERGGATTRFSRCNLFTLPLEPTIAHGGTGPIEAVRIATRADLEGGCEFIDYAVVPPGAAIGFHEHPPDEQEYYLVLGGGGRMRLEDEEFTVTAGDLVRNPGGGGHGLSNTGAEDLRLFVFAVTPGAGRVP